MTHDDARTPPEVPAYLKDLLLGAQEKKLDLQLALAKLSALNHGFSVDLHLGDNADAFPGVPFAGLTLSLPIRITSAVARPSFLILRTSHIETYADWQKHEVKLDDVRLGYLSDNTGSQHEYAVFWLRPIVRTGEPQRLTIEVGAEQPGLLDDFIVRGVYAVYASLTLGWAG